MTVTIEPPLTTRNSGYNIKRGIRAKLTVIHLIFHGNKAEALLTRRREKYEKQVLGNRTGSSGNSINTGVGLRRRRDTDPIRDRHRDPDPNGNADPNLNSYRDGDTNPDLNPDAVSNADQYPDWGYFERHPGPGGEYLFYPVRHDDHECTRGVIIHGMGRGN